MSGIKGIPKDKLKIRFTRPPGEVSRRDLLRMVVPRYEVIPFVDDSRCTGGEACGLCLEACKFKAVRAEDGKTVIDTSVCNGCGLCVDACPHQAIVYPGFSPAELDEKMQTMLRDSPPEHWIIAFVCDRPTQRKVNTASLRNVLSISLPSLEMAFPWLILRALERGATGVALIDVSDKNNTGIDSTAWSGNISFVQALLEHLGIAAERVRAFVLADNDALTEAVDRFAGEVANLGPVPFKGNDVLPLPEDGLLLPSLISNMIKRSGTSKERRITEGTVPFGVVSVDNRRCAGCGICAGECPTGALTASLSDDAGSLVFHHDRCVACGRCRAVCPEKCLNVERTLDLAMLGREIVLFEGGIARCRDCGSAIGTKAMVDMLRMRLADGGIRLTSQLELCPACKTRAFLDEERDPGGPDRGQTGWR